MYSICSSFVGIPQHSLYRCLWMIKKNSLIKITDNNSLGKTLHFTFGTILYTY